MATKSSLLATILAKWGDITSPKRLPTLDRDVANTIVDEIYPSVISDSSSDETYTEIGNPSIIYTIEITKQGRSIRVDGIYINSSTSALPANTVIYTQKDNQYKGKDANYIGEGVAYSPFPSKLVSMGIIPANSTTRFFITYNANE